MRKFLALQAFVGALLVAGCASGPATTPTSGAATAANTRPATQTPLPTPPTIPPPSATLGPPTATPLPPIATTKIVVNVRAGPDAGYPLLGKLKKGDRRPILGKSEDGKWWQIDLDGRRGWIPADYTDVQGGTNLVAIVLAVPLATPTPVSTRAPAASAPGATPTIQVPTPDGRIYFVIQQAAKWMAPAPTDQVFPAVTVGTPGDLNPAISTNASPLDWSSAAGKLAYVFNNGSQDKLLTIDRNSTVATLASHGAIVTPRWFGDGSQLAFIGFDNNLQNQSLYIVGATDGRVMQNCPARSGELLRGLAIDKKTGDIAFVSNYSGRFEIWRMSRSCGSPVQLTFDNAEASAPAFSTDGTKLAYVSNKNAPTDYRIYLMASNGGSPVQLGPTSSFAPGFSPDGFWIVFWHNLSIYIMDTTGGNVQALTPGERPTWAQ